MAIVVSRNGRDAKEIERSPIEQEGYLQKYIYDNPESLPLSEIKEDISLFIIAREFPTSSGPIDALGIDSAGEIYLIETKLYKNPDKRLVVAQILDYGASLWHGYNDFSEFVRIIDDQVNEKFNVGLNQKLRDRFGIADEGVSALLENIERNLNDGNFRFVVLMDRVSSKLKDLIVFMNQNTKFDIFAAEMEFYKYEDYEILITKMFGLEVKKNIGGPGRRGTIWTEKEFFDSVENEVSDKAITNVIKELYEFTRKESSRPPWLKRPTKYGIFNFFVRENDKDYSLFNVRSYGCIRFYGLNRRNEFRKGLQDLGLDILDDAKEREFRLDVFKEEVSLEDFKKVVMKLVL